MGNRKRFGEFIKRKFGKAKKNDLQEEKVKISQEINREDLNKPNLKNDEIRKIEIRTTIGDEKLLMSDEEIEQYLTFEANGSAALKIYKFDKEACEYVWQEPIELQVNKSTVELIFSTIADCLFYNEMDFEPMGESYWEMIVTNTQGYKFNFIGPLSTEYIINNVNISDFIRKILNMPELWLFDKKAPKFIIEKIKIDYHRVTKLDTNNFDDKVTWDYSESLTVNRQEESIEHIQKVATGCKIYRKFQVEDGVSTLLNELGEEELFDTIVGNPDDVIEDSNEIKEYVITLDFKNRPQRVISGSFDKNGLPTDWQEFADFIFDFMTFYGLGEIFNPRIYNKQRRCRGDYIYCSVKFQEWGKSYYYLTEDDSIEIGDEVIVPVGNDMSKRKATVVNIEYFKKSEVPFPLSKTKTIIGKVKDERIY